MKKAVLVGTGHTNNSIFDSGICNNPDNWYYPFWELKKKFAENNIDLNTEDLISVEDVDFELHLDVQKTSKNRALKYVLLYETPAIRPLNENKLHLEKYRFAFTWNENIVNGCSFIKFNLPNKIIQNNSYGWRSRDKLCCLIAGNKAVTQKTPLELYSERINTIRWFEENAPLDFDLFGSNWDSPAATGAWLSLRYKKLNSFLKKEQNQKKYFPSFCGPVNSKLKTMKKYRFSICYENIRDLPGYITEKIWDCFFAGCVPVYWGASNIANYIPEDCYIDRRNFLTHEDLYRFMTSMTEAQYIAYQERAASFLSSDKALKFGAEAFAEIIVSHIVRDLGAV